MIAIISGTNRPGSRTRVVAGSVHAMYESLGQAAKLLDLAELPLGLFAPGAYENKPEGFDPFRATVLSARGLVIVTPEYNGGFPGVLKLFIDMLPFPESFERRPVCFIGLAAGQWGALRPVEQLQQIFGYRNAHIFPERVFLPAVHDLVDDKGMKDEEIRQRLEKQAKGFTGFVRKFSSH